MCCWLLLTWHHRAGVMRSENHTVSRIRSWSPDMGPRSGYLNEDLLRCLTSTTKGLWHVLMRQFGSKDVLLVVAHLTPPCLYDEIRESHRFSHSQLESQIWVPEVGTWMRTSLDVWLAQRKDFDTSWWDSLGRRMCCWLLLTWHRRVCMMRSENHTVSRIRSSSPDMGPRSGYLNEDLLRCLTSTMKGLWNASMRRFGSKDVLLVVAHLTPPCLYDEIRESHRFLSFAVGVQIWVPEVGTWMRTSLDVWLAQWRDFDTSWWDSLGGRMCCWLLLTWHRRACMMRSENHTVSRIRSWSPDMGPRSGYLNEDLLRCLTSTMKGLWHALMRQFGSKSVLLVVAHLTPPCLYDEIRESHRFSHSQLESRYGSQKWVLECGPP